jgi:hypothetical protein
VSSKKVQPAVRSAVGCQFLSYLPIARRGRTAAGWRCVLLCACWKKTKTTRLLSTIPSSFPCRMLPHSSYGSTRMLAATVHARRRRQYLCPTMTTREMRRRRGRQRPHRWRQRRPISRLEKTLLLSPSQSIPTKLTTPMS